MRWKILGEVETKKGQKRIEAILECLFLNRGLKTKKQQKEFLNPKDPYCLTLKDVAISSEEVKKAIARIKRAIKSKEKIVVYGDYDADGVCATAVMWETLDKLGARVMPFIPKRETGYGLKVEQIDQLAAQGVKLIITVDQGIVQFKQIKHANKIGLNIIVTDHHALGKKKPKAMAIVHTNQLAGVGVAWFFCRELLKAFKKKEKIGLDLVTIGSITDMVPLLEANRSLVKYGLNQVKKTKRIGLQFLYQTAGLDKENIGVYEIGFIIGPRINASGRIQDPMDPLRLLCLKKDRAKALQIATQLDQNNHERRLLTEETSFHARELWLKEDGQSNLIFIQDSTYNEGIIGLVAQKLKEEFYRPAVVISQGDKMSRASARSIKEFNIIEAIRLCADLLGPHGGHPMAAGFSVETKKISLLKTRLQEIAKKQLGQEKLQPNLEIETELEMDDLNFNLLNQLKKLEPFGQGNPQPVFATQKMKLVDARLVGGENQHLKLRFTSHVSRPPAGRAGLTFDAIGFGMGKYYSQLSVEKPIDVAYQLLINQWNGRRELQLKLKEIRVR